MTKNFKPKKIVTKHLLFFDNFLYQRTETTDFAFNDSRTTILWQQKNPSSGYLNKLSPELQIKFEKEFQDENR